MLSCDSNVKQRHHPVALPSRRWAASRCAPSIRPFSCKYEFICWDNRPSWINSRNSLVGTDYESFYSQTTPPPLLTRISPGVSRQGSKTSLSWEGFPRRSGGSYTQGFLPRTPATARSSGLSFSSKGVAHPAGSTTPSPDSQAASIFSHDIDKYRNDASDSFCSCSCDMAHTPLSLLIDEAASIPLSAFVEGEETGELSHSCSMETSSDRSPQSTESVVFRFETGVTGESTPEKPALPHSNVASPHTPATYPADSASSLPFNTSGDDSVAFIPHKEGDQASIQSSICACTDPTIVSPSHVEHPLKCAKACTHCPDNNGPSHLVGGDGDYRLKSDTANAMRPLQLLCPAAAAVHVAT